MNNGRQHIDVDAKIAAAETQEEKDAWEAKREGFKHIDFCEGWHVGIYKQACGHWEVLQSPLYINHDGTPMIVNGQPYTAATADKELKEQSKQRNCTSCICGFKKHE